MTRPTSAERRMNRRLKKMLWSMGISVSIALIYKAFCEILGVDVGIVVLGFPAESVERLQSPLRQRHVHPHRPRAQLRRLHRHDRPGPTAELGAAPMTFQLPRLGRPAAFLHDALQMKLNGFARVTQRLRNRG